MCLSLNRSIFAVQPGSIQECGVQSHSKRERGSLQRADGNVLDQHRVLRPGRLQERQLRLRIRRLLRQPAESMRRNHQTRESKCFLFLPFCPMPVKLHSQLKLWARKNMQVEWISKYPHPKWLKSGLRSRHIFAIY